MKKFAETVIKNDGGFFAVHKNGITTYEIQGLTSSPLIIFGDWISLEDHQAEIAKLNSKIDWLHGLLDGRNEEVLQTVKRLNEAQPEIREVPQFVADWLDKKPLYTINSFIPVEIIEWSKKQTGYEDLGMNINHLLKLKVNGYTVAKEKRFYLKNKLTGDCLARCLSRASSGLYVEVTEKWLTRKEQTSYQLSFTQQEIDSMETGSYEQIEVEE